MRRRFTSNRKTSSARYCAITATQDGTNIRCGEFEYIYYAINDISNWMRGSTYVIATLNTGDTIYLKSPTYVGFDISCDKAVELSGSILSLVYGDNNSNETSLSHTKTSIARFSNVVSVSSDFLPSKDLGENCYYGMFSNCPGLIKAPVLPATTLVDGCYFSMFDGCTNLNYIKMLATDISASNCLSNWVYGVSPTGTFVKSKDATWDVVGNSGVPTGWTVITDDQEGGGSDSMFPATIVYSYMKENTNNADVVMYLLEKYPDMSTSDRTYTPISEQIEIVGSEECDGVVVGVSKWSDTAVLLFTEQSFANDYGLRVVGYGDPSLPAGQTNDWFTD